VIDTRGSRDRMDEQRVAPYRATGAVLILAGTAGFVGAAEWGSLGRVAVGAMACLALSAAGASLVLLGREQSRVAARWHRSAGGDRSGEMS